MNADARIAAHRVQENALLAALPTAEFARMASGLELVPLVYGWHRAVHGR